MWSWLRFAFHISAVPENYRPIWRLLRRKCYAHFHKNAKQCCIHSVHACGGITLWQSLHLRNSWMFPWAVFSLLLLSQWNYLFLGDLFLGSGVEEKGGLNDLRLTPGALWCPELKTERRNRGFDTNVWYFSYSVPCEAQTFTAISM